jgi:hypothetical protein
VTVTGESFAVTAALTLGASSPVTGVSTPDPPSAVCRLPVAGVRGDGSGLHGISIGHADSDRRASCDRSGRDRARLLDIDR